MWSWCDLFKGCQPWLTPPCNVSSRHAQSTLGPHPWCGDQAPKTPKCDLSCYNSKYEKPFLDDILKGWFRSSKTIFVIVADHFCNPFNFFFLSFLHQPRKCTRFMVARPEKSWQNMDLTCPWCEFMKIFWLTNPVSISHTSIALMQTNR